MFEINLILYKNFVHVHILVIHIYSNYRLYQTPALAILNKLYQALHVSQFIFIFSLHNLWNQKGRKIYTYMGVFQVTQPHPGTYPEPKHSILNYGESFGSYTENLLKMSFVY